MAIVTPAPGELAATARLLLQLADHPQDVRTTGNGTSFDVPDDLADLYIETVSAPKRRRKPTQKEA